MNSPKGFKLEIFTSVRRCGGVDGGKGGFEKVGFKKINTDG
jgi:hypothetical protein